MRRSDRAFTLVELLVTIGIIALLVGLVIVSMKGVRLGANRAASVNSLRQMMIGYITYATDHNGMLMPGYIAEDDIGQLGTAFEDLVVRLPNDELLQPGDAGAYVWRLAPYIGNAWNAFFVDYRNRELLTILDTEYNDGIYGQGTRSGTDVGIGYAPSFGLNSIYLGGDSYHGGSDITDKNPWSPANPREVLAATRTSQVRAPSKIIVFGSCMQAEESLRPPDVTGSQIEFGDVELRPPHVTLDVADPDPDTWADAEWRFEPGQSSPTALGDFGQGGGLPLGRWGADKIPVATFDGAAGVQDPIAMSRDISRWHWDYTRVVSSGG